MIWLYYFWMNNFNLFILMINISKHNLHEWNILGFTAIEGIEYPWNQMRTIYPWKGSTHRIKTYIHFWTVCFLHISFHVLFIIAYRELHRGVWLQGAERWLTGLEHLLCMQAAWVQSSVSLFPLSTFRSDHSQTQSFEYPLSKWGTTLSTLSPNYFFSKKLTSLIMSRKASHCYNYTWII